MTRSSSSPLPLSLLLLPLLLLLLLHLGAGGVAAAAANEVPMVCTCGTGGGTCAPAQLVNVHNASACVQPINGTLNASVVTNASTSALTLDLTGVTTMLGYLSVVDAPRLNAVLTPDLVSLGSLKVRSNPELVSVSFPALVRFQGATESPNNNMLFQLDVRTNAKLTSASFPNVRVVAGVACEDVNLTNPCALPSLVTVNGDYHMKGGNHGEARRPFRTHPHERRNDCHAVSSVTPQLKRSLVVIISPHHQ